VSRLTPGDHHAPEGAARSLARQHHPSRHAGFRRLLRQAVAE
jgi:hypothetical protein